ncbi:RNA polymerase sigma factor [Flexivirga alba]|uniref:RNA polymerase sigma factor n=1 Tax=Flexivirga alba TaxID=702742 RepID=A0ABW2ACU7_9MICO
MLRLIKPVPGEEGPRDIEAEDTDLVRAVLSLGGVPWAELDDGVQIVRLKLLETQAREAAGESDSVREVRAWLTVVSSNVAADWHRRRARDARVQEKLASTLDQYWSDRRLSGTSNDRDTALMVAAALELLSPSHRQVITLRYWADMTVPEIANRLSVPVGTVKSRLHSATLMLRDCLSDTEGTAVTDSVNTKRGRRDA